MDTIRWVWTLMAVFFFIAEIFTAGFVLACFGVGAAVAAVLAWLGLGPIVQLGAFVGVSIAAIFLSRPFADRVAPAHHPGVGADRAIGSRAHVVERIDPASGRGRVRVDSEEWRADSASGEAIAVDAVVTVVGVAGTRLLVRVDEGAGGTVGAHVDTSNVEVSNGDVSNADA